MLRRHLNDTLCTDEHGDAHHARLVLVALSGPQNLTELKATDLCIWNRGSEPRTGPCLVGRSGGDRVQLDMGVACKSIQSSGRAYELQFCL